MSDEEPKKLVITNDTTFTWELRNFSHAFNRRVSRRTVHTDRVPRSSSFYFEQPGRRYIEMFLRCCLNEDEEEDSDKKRIQICLETPSKLTARLGWYISLLSSKGEKFGTQGFMGEVDDNISNFDHYAEHDMDDIHDHRFKLISDDTLTIFCEIMQIETQNIVPAPSLPVEVIPVVDDISSDFGVLYESAKYSDIIIQVGESKLEAHKAILAARSPVFAAMFEHECVENSQNCINITDLSLEAVKELLRFMYTGKIFTEYSCELLVASDKYQIDALKNKCEKSLSENLTKESATKLLPIAGMHSAEILLNNCLSYLVENGKEMSKAEWKLLTGEELSFLLYKKLLLVKQNQK